MKDKDKRRKNKDEPKDQEKPNHNRVEFLSND
jgi:hypothetical protein